MAKVKVNEVTEKSFEGRKYYTFMVCGLDNAPESEKVPFCTVNGQNYHKVGDIIEIGFGRNKDFKCTVRVLD